MPEDLTANYANYTKRDSHREVPNIIFLRGIRIDKFRRGLNQNFRVVRVFRGSILEKMKTIAIIGASADHSKFGNKAVRAFLRQGYTVYPVNPKEDQIEGLPVFRSVADVPARPHLVSVYLPPPVLLNILPAIAAHGCDELWLNPGTESDAVLALAQQLKLNVI